MEGLASNALQYEENEIKWSVKSLIGFDGYFKGVPGWGAKESFLTEFAGMVGNKIQSRFGLPIKICMWGEAR